MVSREEFLQIVENDLSTDDSGNVVIKDADKAEKYKAFLKECSKDATASAAMDTSLNIIC